MNPALYEFGAGTGCPGPAWSLTPDGSGAAVLTAEGVPALAQPDSITMHRQTRAVRRRSADLGLPDSVITFLAWLGCQK
jgi:hypothetical protein